MMLTQREKIEGDPHPEVRSRTFSLSCAHRRAHGTRRLVAMGSSELNGRKTRAE